MAKKTIIHMFDPMSHNSPFDINMALDAGYDTLIPYANVKLEQIPGLTQDVIFSRGPSGAKQTAIYIGGRDIGLAIDMLKAAKGVMFPPFQVSLFADPSGAFTTAAALVACVEKTLKDHHNKTLSQSKVVVFGGTGPVGITTGILSALEGAHTTIVDHLSEQTANDMAKQYGRMFDAHLHGASASDDAEKIALLQDADIVFCTAKAGINVLNKTVISSAQHLKVAADVNAVQPAGIDGIGEQDMAKPLALATQSPVALGIGALAVGNIKYKLQQAMLKSILEAKTPISIDFREAFAEAKFLV